MVCEQVCNNIVGSFNCSCDTGYMIGDDGRSCNGECRHYMCAIIHTIIFNRRG